MTVIQNALRALNRLVGRNKIYQSTGYVIGGQPLIYPDIDIDAIIEKGYEGNAAVYTVVKKDAVKFASIPQYVYKVTGKQRKAEENDLSKLLKRPNEFQGGAAFREAVRGFRKLCGESFIWLNRGDVNERYDSVTQTFIPRTDDQMDRMPVVEMYVVPPQIVKLIPDPNNKFGILGYQICYGGKDFFVRKNDMIHWRSPGMFFDVYGRQHLRGMSPLKPGRRLLTQDNDATDSMVRMYQNDGARGLLYNETFDDLTVTQKSNIDEIVSRKVNNLDVKGTIATVQGKWGFANFGGTAVDMDLIKAQELTMRRICNLLDVPPEFFMDTTYENKEKAMRGWVYNSMIPAINEYDDELNRLLLKAFNLGSNYIIANDTSELPELQEDMQKFVSSLASAWWLTPNEKREAMRYEVRPEKEFDEPYIPSGITPLSMSNQNDGFDAMKDELAKQGINS